MKENNGTISNIIGDRIRKLRTEQKLSQEELAFASELHSAYIGNIERGEKCPTVETLYKIAKGLKLPLYKLLDFTSETTTDENVALFRINEALCGLNDDEKLKVAQIVEHISELIKHNALNMSINETKIDQ